MQRVQQSEDDGSVSSSLSQLDQVSGGKYCSCCVYYKSMGESEKHSNLGDDLTKELPLECMGTSEKMFIGLLEHYFVNRHPNIPSIGPLSPADCIGDKFCVCSAFEMMKVQVKNQFPDEKISDSILIKQATSWFKNKQLEFENFHQIEIVHRAIQEPDPSLENKTKLKIFVPADCCDKDEMLLIILDNVYSRFSVGFIMSWGIHGQKSTRLYQVIQKKISDKLRKAKQETTDPAQFSNNEAEMKAETEAEKEAKKKEIEDFAIRVHAWYHSKLPIDNPLP